MTKLKKNSEGFYFLSLSLENVRCFASQQTLDLSDGNGRPAQWTVILGDNGTGKTTLLEVLSLSEYPFAFKEDTLHRINSSDAHIEINFASNNKLENKEGNFKRDCLEMKPFKDSDGTNIGLMPICTEQFIRPKFFFYSASRKLRKKNSPFVSTLGVAYMASNDKDELIDAEKWLLETDYIASKASEIQENYKKRFAIIKAVLITLLPDVENIRITDPSEKSPNPRVEFKLPDGWLLLSQLSLGYQTMTAWMVDLAARLFNFYPDSPNPIAEPAIVLIDEIDLHLHPKWQRTIMSYLSERFVNTQFIVTAHSPLIVQAAENANIVVLKREGDGVVIHQQTQDVQGWRIDQLLTSDLFDLKSARSPHYESLLKQRRQILSKPELSADDQAQLKSLEAQIGDLPTAETADDIQAMDIIRRAAQLLKQA